MQPEQPVSSPTPGLAPKAKAPKTGLAKRRRTIIIVIAAVVALLAAVGLVFWLQKPSSQSANTESVGPGVKPTSLFSIGKQPYLFACSVLQRQDIAATLPFELREDKLSEVITAEQAAPHSPTPGKTVDIAPPQISSVMQPRHNSLCRLRVEQPGKPAHVVALDLQQHVSAEEAKQTFDNFASIGSGTSLPSFKKTSSINQSSGVKNQYSVMLVHQDLTFDIIINSPAVTAESLARVVDGLAKKIVERMNNTAEATKPPSFTNFNRTGNTPLVDACDAFSLNAANKVLGAEFAFHKLKGIYSIGLDGQPGLEALGSTCYLKFRFNEDKERVAGLSKRDQANDMNSHPHNLDLTVRSYPKVGPAKEAIEKFKAALSEKPKLRAVPFEAGEAATAFNYVEMPKRVTYQVAKDEYFIEFDVIQKERTEPYVTTTKELSAEQIKKLLDALTLE